jgi:hypothetical protein
MQEITNHLLTECNFSEAVWDKVAADCQTHLAVTPLQKGDIKGWLSAINHAGSKSKQQINVGVVCLLLVVHLEGMQPYDL